MDIIRFSGEIDAIKGSAEYPGYYHRKRQIDKVGLTPDVVVTMTADDINANHDPQLDKAIELLTTLQ